MLKNFGDLIHGYISGSRQLLRYFVVALIGLGFDFGSLIFLREVIHMHYLIASAGGFIVGLLANYLLSERYVFSDPKIKSRTINFLLFGVIGLVGLGILSLLMFALTSGLGMNYLLSKIFATIFVYMWNFIARKKLYHN